MAFKINAEPPRGALTEALNLGLPSGPRCCSRNLRSRPCVSSFTCLLALGPFYSLRVLRPLKASLETHSVERGLGAPHLRCRADCNSLKFKAAIARMATYMRLACERRASCDVSLSCGTDLVFVCYSYSNLSCLSLDCPCTRLCSNTDNGCPAHKPKSGIPCLNFV